jgi:hypothetical protein
MRIRKVNRSIRSVQRIQFKKAGARQEWLHYLAIHYYTKNLVQKRIEVITGQRADAMQRGWN